MEFDLDKVFRVARIELEDEDREFFKSSLKKIGDWIEEVSYVDNVQNFKPAYNVFQDLDFCLQRDGNEINFVDREDFLANAAKTDDKSFLVEKFRD